ncbi:MAG: sporulation protein, partial [Acidimicrobiia bacterium]|nr:sporulation protein [Acidimicrobiia bacterium]
MNGIEEFVGEASDMLTVRRVFGEPYERNGVTLIPAAAIRGGGGGGGGESGDGGDTGSGMGFG